MILVAIYLADANDHGEPQRCLCNCSLYVSIAFTDRTIGIVYVMYCSAYAIGPWAHLEGTEAAAACSEAQMFECSLNLFLSMLLTLPTLAYPSVYISSDWAWTQFI